LEHGGKLHSTGEIFSTGEKKSPTGEKRAQLVKNEVQLVIYFQTGIVLRSTGIKCSSTKSIFIEMKHYIAN
jgi:hypothetical protein